MATKSLQQQIDEANARLAALEAQRAARAGKDLLIEPAYESAYAAIESPELKQRISKTASEMYSAPATLRTAYKGLYNPADQERLVAQGQSQIEQKLNSLINLKKQREATASTVGKNALARYQAGTAQTEAEYNVAKSAYDRLIAQQKEETDTRQEDQRIALDRYKSGLPTTDWTQLGYTGVQGNKQGGSISWRNNNPLNLKFAQWETQYGATKDPNSAFAVFPDIESAKRAYKALLRGKTYGNLDPDSAWKLWSDSGYNYQELVSKFGAPAISKRMKDYTDQELEQIFEAAKVREGWEEGTVLTTEEKTDYTPDQLKKLEQKYGTSWKTSTSRQEQLDYLYGEDQIEKAVNSISNDLTSKGIPREVATGVLRDFREGYTLSEIEKSMTDAGWPSNWVKFIIDSLANSSMLNIGNISQYSTLKQEGR